ncbi:MAG TPA: RHS repeat-associated core domain-containing protein [Steroidobacteraceae bacterium]|nr:RHS repeat-associated core domain-containing protein [Steroidobacteraceae bacterium]
MGIQLNTTGTSGVISFVTTPVTQIVTIGAVPVNTVQVFGNNQLANSATKHLDFDGDGRQDLLLYYQTLLGSPGHFLSYDVVETLLSRNTGPMLADSAIISSVLGTQSFEAMNWNDDACTDLTFGTQLLISKCDGTTATSLTLPAAASIALDWDGDGRDDLLANVGGTWQLYQSVGNSFVSAGSAGISAGSGTYVVTDQNGDGLDDLAFANSSSSYAIAYGLHKGASQQADLASSFEDGYGNAESATYIPISQNNYTEHFSGVPEATYPDQDYIGPLYVVSQADFSDASSSSGATYNQTFAYFAAWTNLQGRGFEGFGTVRTLDSRNGLYDYRYYERGFPYTGMLYEEIVSTGSFFPKQSVGTPPSSLAAITIDGTANNERYFPRFSNVAVTHRELNGPENGDLVDTTSTDYTYDNYGNATKIVSTVKDNDPGSPYLNDSWVTTVTNTTDVDTAHWCLGLFTETQVAYTATIGAAVTRTKTMPAPDTTNCHYSQIITEPSGGIYKVTENLLYDNFGNVNSDSLTGANVPNFPTRTVLSNWGTTGQFLNSRTDASGAKTQWAYTNAAALAYGLPDNITDPNTLTTSWDYDEFGRKTKESRPDGTSTTWTWSSCTLHCGVSNSVYQVARTMYQSNGATIRTDTSTFDPIDRVTQTLSPTVSGPDATVQKLYNSLGLLVHQSIPFLTGATVYQQTFAYDSLNRLTSASRPINSMNSTLQTTTYAYAGRKLTQTDPQIHTKTTITDVNGWLRRTTDGVGYYVTRAYDSAGSVNGVTDSVGNSLLTNVTVAYGIKPFVTGATDADRGAWLYTVDSFGERTSWNDAKGQTFSMTYDQLSRPASRTDPITTSDSGLFSQWKWGSTPASHDVGQLISECSVSGNPTSCGSSPQYLETRVFDSLGRLSTRDITLSLEPGNDPGGVFRYTYTYDSMTGLPSTLTYPISTSGSPLILQYGYQYGLLQTVTDTSDTTATCGTTCVLWTANTQNAFGEVTKETLGNNVVTNRTYDLVTSWLSKATAGVGGGTTLLNQSYAEDLVGNIVQRQDNNQILTESFGYDADNRINCVVLSSPCTVTNFAYDSGLPGPGNLTTQPGVGTYHYPNPGQPRPHAVTSITGTVLGVTNPSFSYDANGNMTARASSSANIIWSTYNYPTSITAIDTAGTEEVQFSYGPDRQRWEQIYTVGSAMEKTYYVGGLMEVVLNGGVATYRHYINAGAEPVALYSRSGSSNTMSYVLGDHQGSVSTIAPVGGTNVAQSFSAFGQLRNSTSWSGAPTTAQTGALSTYTRQGYDFQTWLGQSMGLNHLNGRVEDAILGRFLSPDPHIPDPTNAQSYNRYSYVNNNPLTDVDPTGFCTNPRRGEKVKDPCGDDSDDLGLAGLPGAPIYTNEGLALDNAAWDLFEANSLLSSTSAFVTQSLQSIAVLSNSFLSPTLYSLGFFSIPGGEGGSTGTTGGSLAFVGPLVGAGVVTEWGTSLGTALAVAAGTLAEAVPLLLVPSPTASDDTTENSSSAFVYRVVDPIELAYLQANGNYGYSPSQSGKYFALTLIGAEAFLNAPMNSNGTLTMTTLPVSVLNQGYVFNDPGLNAAGPSVQFSNPQLPVVYGTMTPPIIFPRPGSNP